MRSGLLVYGVNKDYKVNSGSFKDLECWKKVRVLRNDIRKLALTWPKTETYDLISQIIRSSRSVNRNIAEGHGRFHYQENIQFCRTARGSLTETHDCLICANDFEYIDKTTLDEFEARIDEVNRILNGYINYLKRQKNKNK